MRKYHLVLANDEERDVTASAVIVEASGALTLRNTEGAVVVTYAAGQWNVCEVESRDDRG